MSLQSWDATPEPRPPWEVKQVVTPPPVTYGDTAAAAVRMAMGLPVPDEATERFNTEFDDRFEARKRFREAWGLPPEEDTRPADLRSRLAAEQQLRGHDWLQVADGDETKILKRMRALEESKRIAATGQVYGPHDPNPQRDEALRRIAAANGGTWSPPLRGVAGPT